VGYAGEQLAPSEVARRLHKAGFRDFDLVEMLATLLGESNLYTSAWNDNLAPAGAALKRGDRVRFEEDKLDGVATVEWSSPKTRTARVAGADRAFSWDDARKILSRDIGLGQINIRAKDIGTKREMDLRVPANNIRAIKALFDTRETLVKRRRFNPWYAYTKGWATFPEWFVFSTAEQAEATGVARHWKPTGRYIHKAVVGVANFYAEEFGIQPGQLLSLPAEPEKPKKRPFGDGPRPKENKGRGKLSS